MTLQAHTFELRDPQANEIITHAFGYREGLPLAECLQRPHRDTVANSMPPCVVGRQVFRLGKIRGQSREIGDLFACRCRTRHSPSKSEFWLFAVKACLNLDIRDGWTRNMYLECVW